jgi:hypothetical protein
MSLTHANLLSSACSMASRWFRLSSSLAHWLHPPLQGPINGLHDIELVLVMQMLDTRSCLILSRVSKRLHRLVSHPLVWQPRKEALSIDSLGLLSIPCGFQSPVLLKVKVELSDLLQFARTLKLSVVVNNSAVRVVELEAREPGYLTHDIAHLLQQPAFQSLEVLRIFRPHLQNIAQQQESTIRSQYSFDECGRRSVCSSSHFWTSPARTTTNSSNVASYRASNI